MNPEMASLGPLLKGVICSMNVAIAKFEEELEAMNERQNMSRRCAVLGLRKGRRRAKVTGGDLGVEGGSKWFSLNESEQ